MIYDRASHDPRISQLGHAEYAVWMIALTVCNHTHRETIAVSELDERLDQVGRNAHPGEPPLEDVIDALVRAELAARLPHGHLKMLCRLDLWAFEDEAEATSVIPL